MTDDEIITVVQAHKEGKKIQFRTRKSNNPEWWDIATKTPAWNFEICEYRVAPEPRKPREWILHIPVEPLEYGSRVSIYSSDSIGHSSGNVGNGSECVRVREVIE